MNRWKLQLMSFSSLCVKNIEFAQVLMINNESLFGVVCYVGTGEWE